MRRWAARSSITASRIGPFTTPRLRRAQGSGRDIARPLAIGDGIETDIKGANGAGLDALFIADGIHGEDIREFSAAASAELFAKSGVTARRQCVRLSGRAVADKTRGTGRIDAMPYYIEDLKPGMSESFTKTVTERDIELFGEVSGDVNPVHFDEEFAKGTIFKGRIAHGVLSASYISTVLGMKMPGPARSS
jgi:hypothetical protein